MTKQRSWQQKHIPASSVLQQTAICNAMAHGRGITFVKRAASSHKGDALLLLPLPCSPRSLLFQMPSIARGKPPVVPEVRHCAACLEVTLEFVFPCMPSEPFGLFGTCVGNHLREAAVCCSHRLSKQQQSLQESVPLRPK